MSSLSDNMQAAFLPVVLAVLGESADYRVALTDTTSSSITVVPIVRPDDGTRQRRDFKVSTTDITAPAIGDQVTHGGVTWTVSNVEDEIGGLVLCSAEAAQTAS